MGEEKKTLRLFFALWPDEATQRSFDHAGQMMHRLCGGKRARRDNIHLTLAFLGDVPEARVEALRAIAQNLSIPAFDLNFNRLGWWRRNQIAWSAPKDAPKPLFDLVNGLQHALADEGFRTEDRAYLPHITLLRRAYCKETHFEAEAISWPVHEFVLVSSELSEKGSIYEIIGRWALKDGE